MREDLTGKRFGKLVVTGVSGERKNGYLMWNCRCDCGNEVLVDSRRLKKNTVKSCGCVPRMKIRQNLRGKRYGRLIVLQPTDKRGSGGEVIWLCQCDCGNVTEASGRLLQLGKKKSCGCLMRERMDADDLAGRRFGQLEVLSYAGKQNGFFMWNCRCDCGKEWKVRQSNLQSGHTTSCGCNFHPNAIRHMVEGTCVEMIASKTIFKSNTSGIRGVYWNQRANRWIAQITFKGKTYYLGSYRTKEEAACARQEGEAMYREFLDWYYGKYPKRRQ